MRMVHFEVKTNGKDHTTIFHHLNTNNILVQVWEKQSDGRRFQIDIDVEILDQNSINLKVGGMVAERILNVIVVG